MLFLGWCMYQVSRVADSGMGGSLASWHCTNYTHIYSRGVHVGQPPLYSLLGGVEWRESTGLGEQSYLHNYEQTVLHIAQNNHETFPNWGVPGMKNPRLTPISADPSLEPCSREPGPPPESGLGGRDWNKNEAGCPSSPWSPPSKQPVPAAKRVYS